MRRYAETFFRFWFLVLIPLIALPIAGYAAVRNTTGTATAGANLLIEPGIGGHSATYNQYATPAQNFASDLSQWLQSPSFDIPIANGSPLYAQQIARRAISSDAVTADMITNIGVQATGASLVHLTYTNKDANIALQVLQGLIGAAQTTAEQEGHRAAQMGLQYWTYQLKAAQQQARKSTDQVAAYLKSHNIKPDQVAAALNSDTTLAALYALNRSDVSSVTDAQQKIVQYENQSSAPPTIGSLDSFIVLDPPGYTYKAPTKTKLLYIGVASGIGALLASALIVILTALDRSVRYADEMESLFNLPALTVIPYDRKMAARHRAAARVTNRMPVQGIVAAPQQKTS